jgi:hypothetical protein
MSVMSARVRKSLTLHLMRTLSAMFLVAALTGQVMAQTLDLSRMEADVGDAKANFFRIVKLVLGGAALLIVIIGLATSAKGISHGEPHAIWKVAGSLTAAVLLGVAMALL